MRRTHVEGLAAQPLTVPHDTRPGVNLAGFLEGESGLGEVARKLARALEHAGVPFAAIPYRRTPSRQEHRVQLALASEAPFETNVICLNADWWAYAPGAEWADPDVGAASALRPRSRRHIEFGLR